MNQFKIYEEKDATFVDDLKASVPDVERVAQWVRERYKCEATVFPLTIRREASDMAACSDDGDFDAHIGGLDYRVDAKRWKKQKKDFTCREDFPYRKIFVVECHQWDKLKTKAMTYIIMNKKATRAVIVRGSSRWSWDAIDYYDEEKERWRRGYLCPLDHGEWVEIRLKSDGLF